MTLSTIQVLEKAADSDLKLAIAPPDRLTFQPLEKCPPDFVETLRVYKVRLLNLIRLPFVMVFSETLQKTVFFSQGTPPVMPWSKLAPTNGASTRRRNCASYASRTALRLFLPRNCAKSMRSNGRFTGGSRHELFVRFPLRPLMQYPA